MAPRFIETESRAIVGSTIGPPVTLDYTGQNLLIWTEGDGAFEYRSLDPENNDEGDWVRPGSSRMFVSETDLRIRIQVRLVAAGASDVLDIEHDEGV